LISQPLAFFSGATQDGDLWIIVVFSHSFLGVLGFVFCFFFTSDYKYNT
jgi:hypothetical protein